MLAECLKDIKIEPEKQVPHIQAGGTAIMGVKIAEGEITELLRDRRLYFSDLNKLPDSLKLKAKTQAGGARFALFFAGPGAEFKKELQAGVLQMRPQLLVEGSIISIAIMAWPGQTAVAGIGDFQPGEVTHTPIFVGKVCPSLDWVRAGRFVREPYPLILGA
jgi:hypothetical protein